MSSGSETRFGGTVFRHVSPEHTGLDEAILFPSAADQQGQNLAVFSDRLRPGSSLDVIETTPLPLEE